MSLFNQELDKLETGATSAKPLEATGSGHILIQQSQFEISVIKKKKPQTESHSKRNCGVRYTVQVVLFALHSSLGRHTLILPVYFPKDK